MAVFRIHANVKKPVDGTPIMCHIHLHMECDSLCGKTMNRCLQVPQKTSVEVTNLLIQNELSLILHHFSLENFRNWLMILNFRL